MVMKKILKVRGRVLKALAGRLEGFYLAGGTALSVFYFRHRESFDLDFFARDFSQVKVNKIIDYLSGVLKANIELTGEQKRPGFTKMLVYSLKVKDKDVLKIDFVEDTYNLLEPLKVVDGIPVLSIQDIYFRKILTVCAALRRNRQ